MRSSVQETAAASAFDGNLKAGGINGALTSPPRRKNTVNSAVRNPPGPAYSGAKRYPALGWVRMSGSLPSVSSLARSRRT
jgi:hypothetical protein